MEIRDILDRSHHNGNSQIESRPVGGRGRGAGRVRVFGRHTHKINELATIKPFGATGNCPQITQILTDSSTYRMNLRNLRMFHFSPIHLEALNFVPMDRDSSGPRSFSG